MKNNLRTALLMCLISIIVPLGITMSISDIQSVSSDNMFHSGIDIYINEGSTSLCMDMDQFLVHCVFAALPPQFFDATLTFQSSKDTSPASQSPEEMMKVQAVILRTIILNTLGTRKSMDASEVNLDFINTQTMKSQLKNDYDTVYSQLSLAVNATSGEALYYESKLALPLYFRCSNGHTRSMEEVFGSPLPYLISQESPADLSMPEYESEVQITPETFIGIMQKYDRNFYASPISLTTSVQIIDKDSAGYVKTIQAGNISLSGDDMRYLLNLPSSSFSVKVTEKMLTFTVQGHGHGVGLSQWGAAAMASEGKTYKEILSYYYPGATVQ